MTDDPKDPAQVLAKAIAAGQDRDPANHFRGDEWRTSPTRIRWRS